MNNLRSPMRILCSLGLLVSPLTAQISVSFSGSASSPVPLGTVTNWSPQVDSANPGMLWYRYRVRSAGGDFRMIRDFGPEANLAWAASEHEGMYEMEVTVRNLATG